MHTDSSDQKTAVLSCCVINSGDRRAQRGFRIKGNEVIVADSYRKYKANLVLSQFNKKIVQDEEGKFRGPKAMLRMRLENLEKYNVETDEKGLTFVERDFKRKRGLEKIK
jgi:hypothetical protein